MLNTFKVFLDFDGTLIDSRCRQYNLFKDLVPECTMTFEEYWRIKRQGVSQAEMLKKYFDYDQDTISVIHDVWMSKIEDQNLLELDKPFEGIDNFLNQVSQMFCLCLVTARQNPDLVSWQLDKFGWVKFFNYVLVTRQGISKSEIINQYVNFEEYDIIIGDTGEDVKAGKSLGIRTAAVTYGILDADRLETYSPDYLIASPDELFKLIVS